MEDTAKRVKAVIARQLDVPIVQVADNSSFVSDLGVDSLDTVELAVALEDEFGIQLSDEQAEKMWTVQQAIDYIVAQGVSGTDGLAGSI